ncbi:DUF4174 domain-containing protein [Methylobacterium sp. E-045]|uniref:DUF4174 domain-containing protein n=1 Tax=Methylobacterium sp. E-045 TaxID=2836575 RepID=UPI001FB89EC8|nr:DUF4174 domain-containing protein [Methylobacterium sp. E-045]MCJ2132307.1 DUF4174 domain-containing protein [Methylobacterium sp. E-045]
MTRPLLFAAIAALSGLAAPALADDPLAVHRWRSRVLVIVAPEGADPRIEAQRRDARARRADYAERDLVVVEAIGTGAEADRIRARFGIGPRDFRVLLVGKDGDAKLTEAAPIPAARLFATIDAMPMRREEKGRR